MKLLQKSCIFMIIGAIALLGGCGAAPPPSSSVAPLPPSSVAPLPPSSAAPGPTTQFGMIATPMAPFEAPAPPPQEPVVFEEGGKYGYKDDAGNVLVPATYDQAKEFFSGVGRARVDTVENGETEHQWFYVSPGGAVAQYDGVDMFHPELWLAVATREGKYGLINTQFQEVLPLEYDLVTLAQEEDGTFVCYAVKGDQVVGVDLEAKLLASWEPLDQRKSSYRDVVNLEDESLVIVDGTVLGGTLPFSILPMVELDVYDESQKVFTGKGTVVSGAYANTLMLTFDGFAPGEKPFFAVPAGQEIFPRPVAVEADGTKFDKTAQAFLARNGIENTPYAVGKVLTGDLLDTGKTAALLQLAETDAFREIRWMESWSQAQYREEKAAIVSAVLLVPDVEKPLEYRVIAQSISQEERAPMTENIRLRAAAQLEGDGAYEALLEHAYYESRGYSMVGLENE